MVLLAWRGDRLRSPVGVDHALSREGLFVANNVLFVGFAVVVLLGTVFPLLYEAVNGGQVTVGTPYFATVAVPMSVALLVLMTLAPLVGWRTLDAQRAVAPRARQRLVGAWPSWWCSARARRAPTRGAAARTSSPPRAAGAALRTLRGAFVAARGAATSGARFARRAPAGMVVHLGVVVLALAIVTSTSYATRAEVTLADGPEHRRRRPVRHVPGVHDGRSDALESALAAARDGRPPRLAAGGDDLQRPQRLRRVGTPAIDSSLARDVYLTFDAIGGNGATSGAQVQGNLPAGSVVLGVTVEPLLAWLWIGGLDGRTRRRRSRSCAAATTTRWPS